MTKLIITAVVIAGLLISSVTLGVQFISANAPICDSCGAKVNKKSSFCPKCGSKVTIKNNNLMKGKAMLISSVACLVLAVISIFFFKHMATNIDGFVIEKNYMSYHEGTDGIIKNVSQSSSDYTWSLSFEEVPHDYAFEKIYNAKINPSSLSIEISRCTGSVQLIVMQGRVSITESIEKGNYTFDLSELNTGTIDIKIISNGASDFSGTLTLNRH